MDDTIGLPVSAIFYTLMSVMVMIMVIAVTQVLLFYGYVDNKEQAITYNSYDITAAETACLDDDYDDSGDDPDTEGDESDDTSSKECSINYDKTSDQMIAWSVAFTPFDAENSPRLNEIFGTMTVEKSTPRLVEG